MKKSERLADLLNAALKPDRPIQASDFWVQRGGYTHKTWDLARWGVYTRVSGFQGQVCSFDTMTDCVRYGILVSNDGYYSTWEVSANVPPPTAGEPR